MDPQPQFTKIDKTIQTAAGLVVLETTEGFPRSESNLYCIGANDRIIWKAEKPDSYTLFTRVRLSDDGENLSAYTNGGHACELELRTGKLISHTSIK